MATAPAETPTTVKRSGPPSYLLPTEEDAWTPPVSHAGEMPTGTGAVRIQDIGEFIFDASKVETLRPDIFRPGHFSLFDVLVHVAKEGDIALEYHFDETMDTHVIDAINDQAGWWYRAQYSGGWTEDNVFRMDMYPYKNGTKLWVYIEREGRLATIYRTFREEVERLASNGGRVIIPEVIIRSPASSYILQNVVVTPHDVRNDMFQPGVVTALDALLSLGEQGELFRLKLTWYERVGTADPVDTFYVWSKLTRPRPTTAAGSSTRPVHGAFQGFTSISHRTYGSLCPPSTRSGSGYAYRGGATTIRKTARSYPVYP